MLGLLAVIMFRTTVAEHDLLAVIMFLTTVAEHDIIISVRCKYARVPLKRAWFRAVRACVSAVCVCVCVCVRVRVCVCVCVCVCERKVAKNGKNGVKEGRKLIITIDKLHFFHELLKSKLINQ